MHLEYGIWILASLLWVDLTSRLCTLQFTHLVAFDCVICAAYSRIIIKTRKFLFPCCVIIIHPKNPSEMFSVFENCYAIRFFFGGFAPIFLLRSTSFWNLLF